jgi:hypothetical protein
MSSAAFAAAVSASIASASVAAVTTTATMSASWMSSGVGGLLVYICRCRSSRQFCVSNGLEAGAYR